jgi:predicted nucleic acid-binding protein
MAAAEPPAPAPAILYVDTSAMLKLLVREAESAAIERELLQWSELATSVITEVELPRAVARAREERADAVIDGSVVLQGVLASAAIIPLNENIVAAARKVKPVHVGALDAIHIASAISLGRQLAGVATHDKRMQDALEPLGVGVIAPEEVGDDEAPTDTSASPGGEQLTPE